MAKLPNISEQINVAPQTNRSLVAYQPSQVGEAVSGAGQTIGKIAEGWQERQDKLDVAYATADSLQRKIDDEQKATADDDYMSYGQRFQALRKDSVKQSAAMIRNPQLRAQWEANSAVDIAQSLAGIHAQAEAKAKDVALGKFMELGNSLTEKYQATKDPVLRKQIEATYNFAADANSHVLGAANTTKAKMDFIQDNAKIAFGSLSDTEKLRVLNSVGAPLSVRNNNPGNLRGADGEFRKFATPEAGMQAMADDLRVKISGKSAAMKTNFGEGYKPTIENIITTYAPATENDTDAYIKTVSKESGIAPDVPLTESDVAKIMPAMIKVEGGNKSASYYEKTDSDFDRMSPADRAAWLSKLPEMRMADAKLKSEDPAKWGIMNGLTQDEIVGMQPNQDYAKVLPKESAVSIVNQFKDIKNTDQFIQTANAFLQQNGKYSKQAIRDLSANGLKPELEEALLLSSTNPNLYNEQINTLVNASMIAEGDLNQSIKDRGDDPLSVREAVISAMNDEDIFKTQKFEYNPSVRLEYQTKQADLAVKAAKAYMVQNPSASASDAAKFVLKPDVEAYSVGNLNSASYKVPKLYKVDDVEARMESYYNDLARGDLAANNKNFHLNDGVVPVLNEDQQSYRFVTFDGNPIFGKDKKPIVVTISDLLKTPTPPEKAAAAEKLPYTEREAERAKAFGMDVKAAEQIAANKKLAEKMRKPIGAK